MATRFYFNTGTNAALSLTRPLPGGSVWDATIASIPTTKKLGTTSGSAANVSNVQAIGGGGTNWDVLYGQFLSDALAAQTISGNLTGVACVREGNTNADMYTQMGAFVVDSSGTRLHTLIGPLTTGGTEFNSPSANTRNNPRNGSTAMSSYACAAGDRIVVEVGIRVQANVSQNGYYYLGDPGGSDLPAGDGSSNNLTINPWVEFSNTLTFFVPTIKRMWVAQF